MKFVIIMYGIDVKMVDVTVSHPLSPAFVAAAAKGTGTLAEQRARDKHAKYDQLAAESFSDFVAFSMESYGMMGKECISLLEWLAGQAIANSRTTDRIDFRNNAIDRVSCALAVGNARLMLDALPRVHRGHDV